MTTIAWDGQLLAADRLMVNNNVKGWTRKLFWHGEHALAITGNLSVGMEMVAWWRDGADPSKFPAINRNLDEGATLVVATPGADLRVYESTPHAFTVKAPYALGSGSKAAMAAMKHGANAAGAIVTASEIDIYTGELYDVANLRPDTL